MVEQSVDGTMESEEVTDKALKAKRLPISVCFKARKILRLQISLYSVYTNHQKDSRNSFPVVFACLG